MRSISALPLLLASGASLHVQNGDECACLPWKNVYGSGLRCGQGHELSIVGLSYLPQDKLPEKVPTGNGVYDEFCTRFYMQASFSRCLNKKFGTPSEQWCYVHKECQAAEPVNKTGFAIKTCSDQDARMDGVMPEELNAMGTTDGLERGLFGKLAYAMEPEKWSAIEAASGLPEEKVKLSHTMEGLYGLEWSPHNRTEAGATKLQTVRDSGVPTIFDADNGHGGGTVVLGKKIYAFMPSPDKEFENLGYVCIDGCEA